MQAHNPLRENYKSLSEQEQASVARPMKAEGDLSDLQKANTALESKLQSVLVGSGPLLCTAEYSSQFMLSIIISASLPSYLQCLPVFMPS